MQANYRPDRVRMASAIGNEVYELVKHEDDIEKKKKHTAGWYREQVADNLELNESNNPSLRSYEEVVRSAREYYRKKPPLDERWSLGSCINYAISSEVLSHVVSIHRRLVREYGRYLTVRRARWIATLYPVLSPILERAYPNETRQNGLRLMQISSFYTRFEQLAEIKNEPVDTYILDKVFIIDQDVSLTAILEVWGDVYAFAEGEKGREKPVDRTKQILGALTDEQHKLFEQFTDLLVSSMSDSRKWETVVSFIENHQDMQIPIENWLVLSTRQDIAALRRLKSKTDK